MPAAEQTQGAAVLFAQGANAMVPAHGAADFLQRFAVLLLRIDAEHGAGTRRPVLGEHQPEVPVGAPAIHHAAKMHPAAPEKEQRVEGRALLQSFLMFAALATAVHLAMSAATRAASCSG